MTSGHFGGGGGACAPFAHPWIRAWNQLWADFLRANFAMGRELSSYLCNNPHNLFCYKRLNSLLPVMSSGKHGLYDAP